MAEPTPPKKAERARQLDLFDERRPADIGPQKQTGGESTSLALKALPDSELVERVAHADLATVDTLAEEIVARSLTVAVPALERLWRRFHGFGINRPFREQNAVLETLSRLNGTEARSALRRIALGPGVPDSLLPAVLRAAADKRLDLPASFVSGFLDHQDSEIRKPAFALAHAANVSVLRLREGLSDRLASIRRDAAVALAFRGDASGRDMLISVLAHAPSVELIDALGVICDDEVIVELGRCAMRFPDFAPRVVAILRELESPKAERLVVRLETDLEDQVTDEA
ncbi:MAG: hypothetical protein OXF56_22245 [Rhodobacteraceae bacterium]|nr:hypothetical protein [Paracoccaceae bacterium]